MDRGKRVMIPKEKDKNINSRIERFFNIMNSKKDFAYDVETTGLKWQKDRAIGYSVSDGKDRVYIPVRHTPGGNIEHVEQFEKHLAKGVEEHPAKIIGHNLKFDSHFSETEGIKLGNKLKDTMTRAALLDENKRSYTLDACCKEHPGIPQKRGQELYAHIAEVTGCKPDRSAMSNYHLLPGDDVLAVEYGEDDTLSAFCLCERQEKDIYAQNLDVVEDMEQKLTYVLQKMERKGLGVNLDKFNEVKQKVTDLQDNAHAMLPLNENFLPINVRSNKDLQEYFEMCEIDDWPMTLPTDRHPDGQPSFTTDYLGTHLEGMLIIEARKYDHLMHSFIEPFLEYVHNGRIHTNFNQTRTEFGFGAKPGRLSCTNPNLQQVPKRDKSLGWIYRSIFVPDPNYVLVEFDHSQAEPRLYAHYSGEPTLIKGYNSVPFVDMHTIASELMGLTAKLGAEEGRKIAKNLNLGMLYTMGAPKLAAKLKIPLDEARAIVRKWYSIFRNVSRFTKLASDRATERGYVHTILGRRSRFPDKRWCYRAANKIIQGSSADVLKWKMVELDSWILKNGYSDYVHMLINIHDAILFQVHKDYLHLIPEIKKVFIDVQSAPFNLRVPFDADYHVGDDWSEASYGKMKLAA